MNKSAMRIFYVVFGVQLLGLMVLLGTGCGGPVHSPFEQAMETVTALNAVKMNRFEVKSFEVINESLAKVRLANRQNINLDCVVSRKASLGGGVVQPISQSYLGYQVEEIGRTSFQLTTITSPKIGIRCESNTGDFSVESLSFVDFVPIPGSPASPDEQKSDASS